MTFRETLEGTRIKHLDLPPPQVLQPDVPVREAVTQLRSVQCACGLVVENDVLVGIVTERDILNKVVGKPGILDQDVRSIMTSNPVTVGMDSSLEDAIELMSSGGYRNIPVLDDSGAVTTSLNVHKIMLFILDHFPQDVANMPPRPEQEMKTPEGA